MMADSSRDDWGGFENTGGRKPASWRRILIDGMVCTVGFAMLAGYSHTGRIVYLAVGAWLVGGRLYAIIRRSP
jgi:hypothetical protein